MAAPKGFTGNPNGRPKGSPNKLNKDLRASINNFLVENWEQVERDFRMLEPEKRIALFEKLLKYSLPTLQSIESKTDLSVLTDLQIDQIVNSLNIE